MLMFCNSDLPQDEFLEETGEFKEEYYEDIGKIFLLISLHCCKKMNKKHEFILC